MNTRKGPIVHTINIAGEDVNITANMRSAFAALRRDPAQYKNIIHDNSYALTVKQAGFVKWMAITFNARTYGWMHCSFCRAFPCSTCELNTPTGCCHMHCYDAAITNSVEDFRHHKRMVLTFIAAAYDGPPTKKSAYTR